MTKNFPKCLLCSINHRCKKHRENPGESLQNTKQNPTSFSVSFQTIENQKILKDAR